MSVTRPLAAILAADVAGYSRLIGADEEGTLERLRSIRAEVFDPKITKHRGRLIKTTGDGLLVEFGSVVDALRCATEVQQEMALRNSGVADQEPIEFRIGVHQGDIVVEKDDIFGDGVNVAARLEGMAEPGGICVSARVQEDAAGRLNLAFADIGEQNLKNIARPIRVCRLRLNNAPTAQTQTPLRLPDKPSIAVLPFQNISGDPEQEYFADGMVEEIITALSRIRWLFVIARNSSFTYKGAIRRCEAGRYKGQSVDVKQVGRELGVRYVLEGSIRKGGNRVRITAQLVDTETGAHLWADRFDGSLEDVFDLQDQVAASVSGVIEPALQSAEAARSVRRPTRDLTAYDLYLRAYALLMSAARHIPEALRLFEQAITIDPAYGPALAYAAFCRFRLVQDARSENPDADRLLAIRLARRALEVGTDNPEVLLNAAWVLAVFDEDIDAILGIVDRALALNPNSARARHISGAVRVYAGEPDLAIEHLEAALRLSPRERIGPSVFNIGAAHFIARRFDEAVPKLLQAIQEDPSFPQSYRVLAACYAHMGRLAEAGETVNRLREITVDLMPNVLLLRKPEHRELWLSGLQLAISQAKAGE